tara:strand:+ start:74 stop:1402 length:1329 start_codon:yes stop_codon:yes gene_type:complete
MENYALKNKYFLFYTILFLMYCNLFVGWAFQNLKIFGLPINEIVLMLILFSLNIFRTLRNLTLIINILPFLLWLIYGLSLVVIGYLQHGIWALRDGVHIIDSLYFFAGFYLLSNEKYYTIFFKHIKYFIIIAVIYIFFLPFKNIIQDILPQINSAQGSHASISLFNFSSLNTTWIWLAFYIIINRDEFNHRLIYSDVISFLFFTTTVVVFSQRMIYLSIFISFIFLFIFKRDSSKKFLIYIPIFIIMLSIFPLLNIEILNRVGSITSISFMLDHIMSTFGETASGNTLSSTGTVELRLFWLIQVIDNSFESIATFFFGKGFGLPLIEYTGTNFTVYREPHNGYLTIYARMGFIGFFMWILAQAIFFKTWLKYYKFCKTNNFNDKKNKLLGMIFFIIIVLSTAFANSAFEQTWLASMYYILWGVILRMCFNIKLDLSKKLISN